MVVLAVVIGVRPSLLLLGVLAVVAAGVSTGGVGGGLVGGGVLSGGRVEIGAHRQAPCGPRDMRANPVSHLVQVGGMSTLLHAPTAQPAPHDGSGGGGGGVGSVGVGVALQNSRPGRVVCGV